jgi:hypothetical protein
LLAAGGISGFQRRRLAMNIRKELEKFIDTRPFNDKQLCEMWKKWRKTINNSKHVSKEKCCKYIFHY